MSNLLYVKASTNNFEKLNKITDLSFLPEIQYYIIVVMMYKKCAILVFRINQPLPITFVHNQ